MTSLFLLRHAKAVHAEPGMRDFDRPLHRRGIEECAFIAQEMSRRAMLPGHVLCSASERTRQTLELVRSALPQSSKITYSEKLFSADAAGYLQIIREFGDAQSLLVIAHNPCIEELASGLVTRGDRDAIDTLMRGFQTGALAHLEFNEAFSALAPRSASLAAFITPPKN
jgi:phosphohistidine phosphatase